MTRRSVMNDRYRVEQKGKTRKSASAAKPKRAAGEAAAAPAKKPQKGKSALGRAVDRGQSRGRATVARIEQSPREKKLRRIWWACMGAALASAAAMWIMSANKLGNSFTYRGVLLAYVTAIAGALYLEFGPIRAMRREAAAAAKAGKKPKAAPKPSKPAGGTAAGGGTEAPERVAVTSSGRRRATAAIAGLFRRGGPREGDDEAGPS